MITRRSVLSGVAALVIAPRRAGAADVVELRAQRRRLNLLDQPGVTTEAWLFAQGPEPPVIRARQGEELKLRLVNELEQEIWLHFFGIRGPSDVMTINVPPGPDAAVDCAFTPPDAGTFWIGPIADQSRLRGMGLAAVLLVEEREPLPALADLVLVLDDWLLSKTGAIEGTFGDVGVMVGEGRLGNWFSLNNRFRPRLPLAAGLYTRLRMLNAANARGMKLLFRGQDPLLVARNGQPVAPESRTSRALDLGPGERADLLVTATEGDIVLALDLGEDAAEIGTLTAQKSAARPPDIGENFSLPANPLPQAEPAAEARALAIRLQGGLKGGLTSAKLNGEERDLRTLLENGKGWAINGVVGPAAEPLFTAKTGDMLSLVIVNETAFSQPLYIHGHVWRRIDGDEPGPFTDTLVIAPGASVAAAFIADNPGLWLLHSLVAERADGGLLCSFRVEEG